ncbi:C40 family peptidase [Yinghuangia seranimata]|uniref:C40 family peptidase n=1 Tax=Yinghuangia seranimata TaxID=408067 RepID=UPI00248BA3AD|nr:NlpC/P60 family protein [Yinghuangia seranimata]MDI2131770.1 NlpC/P60 family protein [Yinghuangia seranimata]
MANVGGTSSRWARAAAACGVALLCAALFTGQAVAAPGDPTPPLIAFNLADVQTRLQDLYRQAEQATERYNATNERRTAQQVKVNDVRAGIAWTQQQIDQNRDEVGRIARLQYTTRGVDPVLSLMLSSDPAEFLRQAPTFARISQVQADTIERQKQAERQLKNMQKSEDAQLAENARLEKESEKAKTDIQTKVSEAEALVATLTPEQLVQLQQLEAQVAEAGQAQLQQYGILAKPDQLTTKAAEQAIRFALSKLGKPYIWGGTGPDGYDCSGLTSQAWLFAGVQIPRTSQEQWARLPRVPVADMRPGDLIVYFGDASHIAMYVGNGLIIHAPRPGRTITIAQAGSMPILGVVRPDGGAGTVQSPAVPNLPPVPGTPPPTTPPPTTPPPATTDPGTTSPPPTTTTPTTPGGGTTTPGGGTTSPGGGTTTPGGGTTTPGGGTTTPGGSGTPTPTPTPTKPTGTGSGGTTNTPATTPPQSSPTDSPKAGTQTTTGGS